MNHRINAFTVLELLIALLISAMVISLAYAAFIRWNAVFMRWRDGTIALDSGRLLERALRVDLNQGTFANYTDGLLSINNMDGSTVEYHIGDSSTVRMHHTGVRDTFAFSIDSVQTRHPDPVLTAVPGLISGLTLFYTGPRGQVTITLAKHYDSKTLLTLEETEIHEPD